ncbi:MAG TPA: PPC domain-containing DNA-binding protein [Dehalococcoidales bacterium]|nr:PPC domain-containing DNA-binding protein [Dehalococcoidales bacterium]
MKASEGRIGRVFIVRLEDGDMLPDCLERFAAEKGISHGHVVLIGGIGGGEVVVGPRKSDAMPPEPMLLPVDGAHEVVGAGIIAPDKEGRPVLHIHASLGRAGRTLTGCLRPGVTTWLVGEAIIYEITGAAARRLPDKDSGFELLGVDE